MSLAASRCLGNEVLAIFVGEGGEFNYKDICVPGKSVILGLEVGIFLARPPLLSPPVRSWSGNYEGGDVVS